MAEAHWDQTAALIAKLHNVNCTKESSLIRDPKALNPFSARPAKPKVSLSELAALLGNTELNVKRG